EKLSEAKKESALLLLKSKCWQKIIALKKEKETQYQQTLTEELKVIAQLNYADYFLIFSDVAQHLRAENIIVGPGRGSAVASLVAYLLGITQIDPLEHKLFFARFLNEKRKSLPDIDLDVENQDEVFNYLQKKYSKKQVARIITRKKIGWKVALREIVKLYRIDEIKLKEITSLTGENPDFIPLKAEKDYLLTLFEENKLAALGLKKYDFLSLRETLGFIREARSILSTSLPDYQKISLTDQKTWDNLKNFLLTGIFQLDTPSARTLFNRFRPQSFADLVIFLSLNRPGTRKKAEELSQNKNNNAKISFTSPAIREILTETYGHIIFEEQISQILKIEEYDNKETSLNIYAIICGLEKKSESNYILSLQDIRNAFQLNISSDFYQKNKENLVIHSELLFTLKIGVKRGKINSLLVNKQKKPNSTSQNNNTPDQSNPTPNQEPQEQPTNNPLPSPETIQENYNNDKDKSTIENNSNSTTPEQKEQSEALLKLIIEAEFLIKNNQFNPETLSKLLKEKEQNAETYQLLKERIEQAINELSNLEQKNNNSNNEPTVNKQPTMGSAEILAICGVIGVVSAKGLGFGGEFSPHNLSL
ncbi:9614_t:CDS:2, partial [Racocetra persica]